MITELLCLATGATATWFFMSLSRTEEHQERQQSHKKINQQQQQYHQETRASLQKTVKQTSDVVNVSRKILYGTIHVVKTATATMEELLGHIRQTTTHLQEHTQNFVTSTQRIERTLQHNADGLLHHIRHINTQLDHTNSSLQALSTLNPSVLPDHQQVLQENNDLKRLLSESVQLNQYLLTILTHSPTPGSDISEGNLTNAESSHHGARSYASKH